MNTNVSSSYINIFKKDYIHDYKEGNLIINKTSCFKVSKEVAYLVEYLPRKGDKNSYLEALSSLKISQPEMIFDKLQSIGIIKEKEKTSFFAKVKKFIDSIFNPRIKIISSEVQEWLLTLILKIKNKLGISINRDVLLKIIASFLIAIFLSSFLFNYMFIKNNVIMDGGRANIIMLILLIILGILMHELGHSFMCSYCGIGLRPICFSIFLIYPVMFTNVSGIDELKLKDRILVNIAGLTSQGVFMIILLIVFGITRDSVLLMCIKMLFDMFYFNLHPLLRTDGYWLFKDILYFTKENRIGYFVNKVYYIAYFGFSVYLGYKAYLIINSLIRYFSNYKDIRFDVNLFMKLFYLYLVIILMKGIKSRFKEFYREVLKKEVAEEV